MLANELLSSLHGQVALKAVHRFLTHNPEWVGQVSRGECSIVQYSTVQYSTVQYSTVQYSTVQEWVGQVSRGECANVDIDVQHVSN